MRIYYSVGSDPVILDSILGLNNIYDSLKGFMLSAERILCLAADASGSPGLYNELLCGLEIEKSEGAVFVYVTPQRYLRIIGSVENLRIYIDFFRFAEGEESHHHHPEYVEVPGYIRPDTLSLIIEADAEE
jgi:hypothetical protein